MNLSAHCGPLIAATVVACAVAARAPIGESPQSTANHDAVFSATLVSLADSVDALSEMIGTAHRDRFRIDPRPLRVQTRVSSELDESLNYMRGVVLDSLSARDRADRIAQIKKHGFEIGDLKAVNDCPGAEVRPPGDTAWTVPEPCHLAAAAVAAVGIQSQTSRDATVKLLISTAMPFLIQWSATYTFSHESTWRLLRTSGWTVAE